MWKNDEYYYSIRTLKSIAGNYVTIYEGLPFRETSLIINPWSIAEFKADFDSALKGIGKGRWSGRIDGYKFRDFRYFGRLQQVIIADILGIRDFELEVLGFYRIPQLRGYAYYLMRNFLNGGRNEPENHP